jgi:hypothetical protein
MHLRRVRCMYSRTKRRSYHLETDLRSPLPALAKYHDHRLMRSALLRCCYGYKRCQTLELCPSEYLLVWTNEATRRLTIRE